MKHLIICREYPPSQYAGGIGTYVFHISRLLAECGETVHVIGQLWKGAEKKVEEKCRGRLIIHRVHLKDWESSLRRKLSSPLKSREEKGLLESNFSPQCFSLQACLLAESLVEQEGIDIIEAQEFEAPLYYFQLRRALGIGPKKQPPCIIQLHSPMEFIVRHNDWDIGQPYFMTAKRLEDYSIAAADALLCPSSYVARRAETHYGLDEGSIHVIPLPIGNSTMLEREKNTWEYGTICYVGRLERRKGVIEWIDAVVTVAPQYPSARFEFIGANVLGTKNMSGEEFVKSRIPDDLRSRFIFHGQQERSALPQFLKKARISVVPSRWENFPNTCIESMSSGLPVIASREGGMAEIIEDGRTGWLANKPGSEGLAEALRRALNTPSMKIAEMGYNASLEIRKICDNNKILENQLNFRRGVVDQGSRRSLSIPVNLPWSKRPFFDEAGRRTPQSNTPKGIALVITCADTGQFLEECLQSIEQQTLKPVDVVIVKNGMTGEQAIKAVEKEQWNGFRVIHNKNRDLASSKNAGIEEVLSSGLNPLGFSFLTEEVQLQPDFVAMCESVLQRCPEVGLVSCWAGNSRNDEKIWIRPCPSFPYQWISNDAVPFSAVRTEALLEAGNFRTIMNHGYEDWDLFNAVMAGGWVAVTVPRILGKRRFFENLGSRIGNARANERMRRELLERFPDLTGHDSKDIIILTESYISYSLHEQLSKLRRELKMVRTMYRLPRQIALRILGKVKKKLLRRAPV
ncbi:MAG: glycosyltransferase [Nitrospirae bacterium]|nr:glycosyltransferase [Nitrospirota bacterium]